jgi:4-hydroxyproline epimerase
MHTISCIDSHTGGEPTRLILDGMPDLGSGSVAQQLAVLRERHDALRRCVNTEPRGSDVLVSALLVPPQDASSVAGVIFFNNVGYLGMCGHGTIGLVASLAYLGRIGPGVHRIETPVGVVEATLHASAAAGYANRVSLRNVPSYRHATQCAVDVPGIGRVHGDVAWGGNWFYLTHEHGQRLAMDNLETLTETAWRIRAALAAAGIGGADGAEIDHVELLGPGTPGISDSKGFMLCPGKAYDRSPCGTGTSAKLACLVESGALLLGAPWRHEGIVGSVFEGSVARDGDDLIPTITGEAWVMGEVKLLIDPRDPFANGIAA